MGIKQFSDLDALYDMIEKDLASSYPSDLRYPARFIFLDTFQAVNELTSFLRRVKKARIVELSDFLPFDDGWFTPQDIVRRMEEIKKTSVVVLLSEFLRFQSSSSFYAVVKGITEIESQGNFRIYIPLLGLWEKFEQEFWKNFYRKDAWAPIWKGSGDTEADKVTIYQVDFPLDMLPESSEKVCNTREWLNLWKNQRSGEVFCFSKPISAYCHHFLPDEIFSLKEVRNQKEFLRNVLDVDIPIEFKPFEAGYWEKLIDFCFEKDLKGASFNNIFSTYFNLKETKNLSLKDYVKLFLNEREAFSKWMVRNFFLSRERFKGTYFSEVLKAFDETEELNFIRELWCKIFGMDQPRALQFAGERREILSFIHRDLNKPVDYLEKVLKEKIKGISSSKELFPFLTGILRVERMQIIELFDEVDKDSFSRDVKEVYPELHDYLAWNEVQGRGSIEPWIKEYFSAYTVSKVSHKKSEVLSRLLEEKNLNKGSFAAWFYNIKKPNLEDKEGKFVWIDGLGAEWFSLFSAMVEKYGKVHGKYIAESGITRVNLPTVTECNRHDCLKLDALDQFVHQENPYKHPDCLVDEMDIVKNLAQKIVEMRDTRIVVVSDHGFTFLCTKDFGNFKKLNFSESNHEGRCMWVEKSGDFQDDAHFMVWQSEEGPCRGRESLVALKHVSLFNTPFREVHGGATPEEVLVPYFVIETIDEKIVYKITPLSFEVSIKNPLIQFRISPKPHYFPEVVWKNKSFKVEYSGEKDLYEIDLKGLKTGFHELVVKIGNKRQKIDVKIKGGFTERELI